MRKIAVLLCMFMSLPAFADNALKCQLSSVYKADGMSSRKSIDASKLSLGHSESVSASLTGNCPAVIGYSSSSETTFVFYFNRVKKQEDGSTTCNYSEVTDGYTVWRLSCDLK